MSGRQMGESGVGTAFRRPKARTLCLPAPVTGREIPSEPIEAGRHYVTIEVVRSVLARSWFATTRWHPIIVSELAVASTLQTQLRHHAVVDPRKISDGIVSSGATVGNQAAAALCTLAPWTGKVTGKMNLLSLRSEKLLKQVVGLAETLRGAFTGAAAGEGEAPGQAPEGAAPPGEVAGAESVVLTALNPVLGAVKKVAEKAGVAVLTRVAEMIIAEDGAYTSRLAGAFEDIPLAAGRFATGYFALIAEKGAAPKSVEVRFDGAGSSLPELYLDGRHASSRDYVLIRVSRATRHDDIEAIPDVSDAWRTLRTVVISGGDTAAAYRAFRAAVNFAPQLLDHDRAQLLSMVQGLLKKLTGGDDPAVDAPSAPGASGQESFTARKIRHAQTVGEVPSLAEAWRAGGFEAAIDAAALVQRKLIDENPSSGLPQRSGTQHTPVGSAAAPGERTKPRFQLALDFCFKWEGDYSDIAADKGGKTKYGITEAVFKAWRDAQVENGSQDSSKTIQQITKDDARAIYWSNYWRMARCDQFQQPLDLVMFDTAVNHGPGGAGRILQRTLNTLAEAKKPAGAVPLRVDGGIGPRTLTEAARYTPRDICSAYLEQRRATYNAIVAKDATQKQFLKGWMNRIADLARVIASGDGHESGHESVSAIVPENTPFAGYAE